MKSAIITTTIFVPKLLEKYVENVKQNGHDSFFVVIGDKKTPVEAKKFCEKLAKKEKIDIEFFDVDDQIEYLKDFSELGDHLTWNSIQRRNIGLLRAYQKGAEKIITIDDDNYFIKDDFVTQHSVGEVRQLEIISSSSGWINVCDYLAEAEDRPFYHRGHPLEERFQPYKVKSKTKKVRVVVNAGFWLGDPDIDAMTRLYYLGNPIDCTKYLKDDNFALDKGTWSTFNSQNTALAREVMPAYFLSPYVGRYDDIWGAYVLKRITDHLGDYIAFGDPLVRQERNPHNYWKDLAKEDMGMILTKQFTDILKEIELEGDDYQFCYKEITKKLEKSIKKGKWDDAQQEYLDKYVEGMKVWIKTFERLNKTK